ncbi:MAG TPA: glycosyltransferase family 4 protein [Gemmataceae bacterium]|jgi:glycosyltransferase involved in cell wall biosynthesis|nr:glycosyltransferase family 4 protein [Gemmataceae bacterium]
MRIAQFVHRYPPALGGAEAWVYRLSKYLVAQGDEVTIWTTTARELNSFTRRTANELPAGNTLEDEINVRRFAPSLRWPGRRYLLKAASLVPIRRWQAMTQPWGPISLDMWKVAGHDASEVDVVHAVAFPFGAIIQSAHRLARNWEVPFVVTPFLHLGDPNDRNDPIRRAYTAPHLTRLLKLADRVIVQTPTESEAIAQLGVARERIVLQGLGVDSAECTGGDREAVRARWGVNADEVVVGHLANQSEEKGTIDLLLAVADARRNAPFIRVVLAGPRMPSFDRFWSRFGPVDWVTQLGPIDDATRRDFFAAIDLFTMPSRSDSFGLVFLEAWANGKPVIGYRAGGVVDVIRHEHDGMLVRCGDAAALIAAIVRLSTDAALRNTWGTSGRERVAAEFQWDDKLRIAHRTLTVCPSS